VKIVRNTFPDFIIIGAMRAGTTALANGLGRHPEIAMSNLKETDFFITEKNYSRGFDWYKSLFQEDKLLWGEASPNYTKGDVFKGVPARIRAAQPDVRLIYIVRDPVDRFWSHYKHSVLMHGGLPPPEKVLDDAEGAHILASSLYHQQIKLFMDEFSAEQIKIVDFDQLTTKPSETLNVILKFLSASTTNDLMLSDKSNSAEDLASTPSWALRLSQHRALSTLRAATPESWRRVAKRALTGTTSSPRSTPPVSADARKRVTAAVADDAAMFRVLTGRAFKNWCV